MGGTLVLHANVFAHGFQGTGEATTGVAREMYRERKCRILPDGHLSKYNRPSLYMHGQY